MSIPIKEHPTVQAHRQRPALQKTSEPLDAGWLKQIVLDAGADDVGFVEIARPALDDERQDILPHAKTLISFVVRMNREAIRTPARSVSNTEFHRSGDEVNDIARSVVRILEDRGIRAMNPAMGFPMEMSRFPGKIWVVSHKPVAVAGGGSSQVTLYALRVSMAGNAPRIRQLDRDFFRLHGNVPLDVSIHQRHFAAS